MSEFEQLDRVLATMRLLQSHLEEANFEVTEFEEVEIFLDLALNAGEQLRKPEHAPVLDRYFK
ncbi:MAG: hypothetical protein JJ931_09490 [Henriciella sp.]|nr:hypothetical protein [Henriciella sp.]MBO6695640.1 hypothetical protein [Henriciella sp.]